MGHDGGFVNWESGGPVTGACLLGGGLVTDPPFLSHAEGATRIDAGSQVLPSLPRNG